MCWFKKRKVQKTTQKSGRDILFEHRAKSLRKKSQREDKFSSVNIPRVKRNLLDGKFPDDTI